MFGDASGESEPDDSESELDPDEPELELERFSLRREPCDFVPPPAAPPRRVSAGGGELAFFRFRALVAAGFALFSIENEIGLAARFSGGGGGARLSGEARRATVEEETIFIACLIKFLEFTTHPVAKLVSATSHAPLSCCDATAAAVVHGHHALAHPFVPPLVYDSLKNENRHSIRSWNLIARMNCGGRGLVNIKHRDSSSSLPLT